MSHLNKKVEDLTVSDFKAYPVWEYTNEDEKLGEMAVQPVKKTPVNSLRGRIVGTQVLLANGTKVWASFGNVNARDPRLTQHFLVLSVFKGKGWFTMARYHDFDNIERGPKALAAFLGIQLDEVFPISYDISRFCIGESSVLVGRIEKEPREKLSSAQLIALAVP
jgi:hypothetical protein